MTAKSGSRFLTEGVQTGERLRKLQPLLLRSVVAIPPLLLWTKLALASSGIPMFGDLNFPLTFNGYLANFANMWNPHGSQSNLQGIDRLLLVQPLLKALQVLHMTSPTTLAKVILIGSLILAGQSAFSLGSFLMHRRRVPEPIAGFAATCFALCFELSPWVMYRESAYFYLVAYALTPLILMLALRLNVQRSMWALDAFLLALWLALSSASPQYTIFLAVIMLATLIWRIWNGRFREVAFPYLVSFAFYLCFSLYWLYPTVSIALSHGISPGYVLNWGDTVTFSRNATLINVLTGYSDWLAWWKFPSWWNPELNLLWRCGILLVPGLAVVAIFRMWKEVRAFKPLLICGLLVGLLAMGAQSPLTQVYRWIEFRAPASSQLGWVIRDPSKVEGYLVLIELLILLEAFGYFYSSRTKFVHLRKDSVRILLLSSVTSIFILTTLPINIYGYLFAYAPVVIPSEYQDAATYLSDHAGSTLWMAAYDTGATGAAGTVEYKWNIGRQAPFFAAESMPGTVFGNYHFTNLFSQEYEYLISNRTELYQKMSALGIRNLVIANDIRGASIAAEALIRIVGNTPGFTIRKRFGDLEIISIAPARITRYSPLTVIGGRMAEDYLYSSKLATNRNALVFAEQGPLTANITMNGSLSDSNLVLFNANFDDAMMTRLESKFALGLTSATYGSWDIFQGWAATSMADSTSGLVPWHIFVTNYLRLNDFWDFGYGLGVVISRRQNSVLEIPTTLSKGRYKIMARILHSPDSGTSELKVGNSSFLIRPSTDSDGMQWTELGSVSVTSPLNGLSLTNISGTTAVNSLAFVPTGIWQRQSRLLNSNLANRPTDAIVSCSNGSPVSSVLYLPKGRYRTDFTSVDRWMIGSRQVRNQSLLESPGKTFKINISSKGCNSALIFKSLEPSKNELLVRSSHQNWDPYWTYSSKNETPKQTFPLDGVLGGAVIGKKPIKFTYAPNQLLSTGIILSETSFAIAGCILVLVLYFRRERRN